MRVYFTFEPREDLRLPLMAEFPQVQFVFQSKLNEEELALADVLVTYGEDLREEHIAMAHKLQWIFVASAGVEKMPAAAITERGIYVSNVRGIHKKPMTESILAHILAQKRDLQHIYNRQREGKWDKKGRFSELNGSTALILGPGAIGGEIGRILQAFDVHTIGVNRSGEPASYMDVTYSMSDLMAQLPKADIVISMLPSTAETKHLFTYAHFEAMKPSALFLNFGRGSLVATEVLAEALRNKEIGHAILDVFEVEPLPADSPLWQLENVTLSPHCSSHSSRYVERSLEIFKPSLAKWLQGDQKLENEMNLMRGY